MSDSFNGYHVWLGIPPGEQPPNHYRLLGIAPFETDLDVIDHAADRQMAHVRTFQTGRNARLSQEILNQLAAARVCLLNPERKAEYDQKLRAELAAKAPVVPVGKAVPVAQPAAASVPRAAPLATPQRTDEFDFDMPDVAPTAEPAFDEDELLASHADLSAPSIELGSRRLIVDRDASLHRSLVYVFVGVVIVVVVLVLFGLARRLASGVNWSQLFTVPSVGESAPLEPGETEPPPAAPAPHPAESPPAPAS